MAAAVIVGLRVQVWHRSGPSPIRGDASVKLLLRVAGRRRCMSASSAAHAPRLAGVRIAMVGVRSRREDADIET